jgi:hypothetical protein
MTTSTALEEQLSTERLKALAATLEKGSGGPAVALPDGTAVTRDVIVRAMEEFTTRQPRSCTQLATALNDPRVHIRYAALVGLQIITGNADPDFQPFQLPDLPANVEAIRRWQARCQATSSGV